MNHPHVLLVAMTAWGHIRPLCVLAAQIVVYDPNVVVTMFCTPNYFKKILPELRKQFPVVTAVSLMSRIRVVSLVSGDLSLFDIMGPYFQAYPAAYQSLVNESDIKCASTGTVFDGVSSPVVVVIDIFCLPVFEATRDITGKTIPILGWIACSAISILKDIGPADKGGPGNLPEMLTREANKLGKNVEEVGDMLMSRTDGSVVTVPGILPMYDYEYYPQTLPSNPPIAMLIKGTYTALTEYDGALIVTSDAYEAVALNALRDWFNNRMSKALFAVGPPLRILSEHAEDASLDTHLASKELVFKEFLDEKLNDPDFGPNSVVFFSFGSVFWPSNPGYVDEVIDAFIEKRFPFIFCTASPEANVSPQLCEKIKSSGIGLWTNWSPQQFILEHPATGWFLTHCGFGGINEALGTGVPMICWPFVGDQPVGAAHLTTNLRVGFELIQVRTGAKGMKPLHPSRGAVVPEGTREAVGKEIRAVIEKCRGAEGDEVRTNAERVKEEYSKAWTKDGAATKEIEAFMSHFVLTKY